MYSLFLVIPPSEKRPPSHFQFAKLRIQMDRQLKEEFNDLF